MWPPLIDILAWCWLVSIELTVAAAAYTLQLSLWIWHARRPSDDSVAPMVMTQRFTTWPNMCWIIPTSVVILMPLCQTDIIRHMWNLQTIYFIILSLQEKCMKLSWAADIYTFTHAPMFWSINQTGQPNPQETVKMRPNMTDRWTVRPTPWLDSTRVCHCCSVV